MWWNRTLVVVWQVLAGMESGITQLASLPGGSDTSLVWNFPVDLTFKSTNVHGWPQLILTVHGSDFLNRHVVKWVMIRMCVRAYVWMFYRYTCTHSVCVCVEITHGLIHIYVCESVHKNVHDVVHARIVCVCVCRDNTWAHTYLCVWICA